MIKDENEFGVEGLKRIGSGTPKVGIVGCTHGDEYAGKLTLDYLDAYLPKYLENGSVLLILGNPKAYEERKRFIDHNLNSKIFSESLNGYEGKRSHELKPIIEKLDYLVDLHTANVKTPPFVFVRDETKKHEDLARFTGIKFVGYFLKERFHKKNALIDYTPVGIGIELGQHDSIETLTTSIKSVQNVLAHLGMIKKKPKTKKQEVLEIFDVLDVPNDLKINKKIKNLVEVKTGEIIGISSRTPILARTDFYPILYGEGLYIKSGFSGFMGRDKI